MVLWLAVVLCLLCWQVVLFGLLFDDGCFGGVVLVGGIVVCGGLFVWGSVCVFIVVMIVGC